MNLILLKAPSVQFRWKDRKDNFHAPVQMETRHLFMTLVLIWNHTMPEDAFIDSSGRWTHHRYNLGPHYTVDYLSEAIGALAQELAKRDDMEPAWRTTLRKMEFYLFKSHQVRLLP